MMKCSRCGGPMLWQMNRTGQFMVTVCRTCGSENCEVVQQRVAADDEEINQSYIRELA